MGHATGHAALIRQYVFDATALCALQLEQRWAAGFDNVLWVVFSDDPFLSGEGSGYGPAWPWGARSKVRETMI